MITFDFCFVLIIILFSLYIVYSPIVFDGNLFLPMLLLFCFFYFCLVLLLLHFCYTKNNSVGSALVVLAVMEVFIEFVS